MATNDEQFHVNRSTINAIFVLLAAVLLFISYVLKTGGEFQWAESRVWGAEVIKDIAVVIFSLALVDILWRRFGGDPVDRHIKEVQASFEKILAGIQGSDILLTEARTQGLARIGSGHREIAIPLLDLFAPAERTIELCGYTLHSVLQDGVVVDKLRDKLRSGVQVRVLISGPETKTFSPTSIRTTAHQ
jgi:hypothetical protein